MQFNSYEFVLLFLPAFLLAYFTFGKRWNRQVIILGGAVFYAFAGWESAAVFAASILITEGIARGLIHSKNSQRRKTLTALCVVLHAAALFFYKYWWITSRMKLGLPRLHIVQPLGFSFFTFQQIMYILAIYRDELAEHSTLDYLSYILYFPKLTMGPMAEPGEIIRQIRNTQNRFWNWSNVAAGFQIFSFGMFKKMFLADTFAGAVNEFFQWMPRTSSLELALIMLSYTFQIYFDFSGYIDMSVGISSMLNISLPLNFDSPYKSVSISDFWKRWHITLTRFFTRNIYIPLGGNRKGKVRTYLNIMIVFLISGMWHGSHPNYLLWGVLNGLLLVLERMARRQERKIPAPLAWPVTFLMINILWLLFRCGTIGQWADLIRKIVSFKGSRLRSDFTNAFFVPEFKAILRLFGLEGIQTAFPWISVAVFMVLGFVLVLMPQNNHRILLEKRKLPMLSAFFAGIALILSILCMSKESVFIYFGF